MGSGATVVSTGRVGRAIRELCGGLEVFPCGRGASSPSCSGVGIVTRLETGRPGHDSSGGCSGMSICDPYPEGFLRSLPSAGGHIAIWGPLAALGAAARLVAVVAVRGVAAVVLVSAVGVLLLYCDWRCWAGVALALSEVLLLVGLVLLLVLMLCCMQCCFCVRAVAPVLKSDSVAESSTVLAAETRDDSHDDIAG